MNKEPSDRQTLAWTFGFRSIEKLMISAVFVGVIVFWGRRESPWWVSWSWAAGVLVVTWFVVTYVKVEVDATNVYVFERRGTKEWLAFVGSRDRTNVTEEEPFLKIVSSPWSRYIVLADDAAGREYRFGSRYLIGRKRLLRTLSSYGKSITEMVSDLENKARKEKGGK